MTSLATGWPLPQLTGSADFDDQSVGQCNFQFWVDRVESFYCKLDECRWQSKESFGESSIDAINLELKGGQTRIKPITNARRSSVLVFPAGSCAAKMEVSVRPHQPRRSW